MSIQLRAAYGFLGAKKVEVVSGDDSDTDWFLAPLMDVLYEGCQDDEQGVDEDVFGGAVASYVAVYRRGDKRFERLFFAESLDAARELAIEATEHNETLVSLSPNLDAPD